MIAKKTDISIIAAKMRKNGKGILASGIWGQRYLYLMSMPFLIWLVLFKYVPIWGWLMSFVDYKPGRSIFNQKWVGLKYFSEVLGDGRFWNDFRNTLGMSVMGLVAGYTVPIIFALFLNEIGNMKFKRSIQTISYLPHFVSWVVVAGIFIKLLSTDGGVVNVLLMSLHILKEPVQFMAQPKLFWGIITVVGMWKEMGWSAIIYLAAIAGIDEELYNSATVDGCGRFQKMWYVTLPGLVPIIVVMFVLSFGALTQIGFEAQYLMGNAVVQDYSEVIDLYVLKYGISATRYAFGTAVGVFNSAISIGLLFSANMVLKKVRGESAF